MLADLGSPWGLCTGGAEAEGEAARPVVRRGAEGEAWVHEGEGERTSRE